MTEKSGADFSDERFERVVQKVSEVGDALGLLRERLDSISLAISKITETLSQLSQKLLHKLALLSHELVADRPSNSNIPAREIPLDALKRIAEISVIAGALLYTAGFGYLYRYYRSFGLSFSDLSIPVQETLVFAFTVAFHSLKSFGLCALLVLPTVFLARFRRFVGTTLGATIFLLALLGCAYGLYLSASSIGYEEAYSDLTNAHNSRLPSVAVLLAPEPGGPPEQAKGVDDRCKPEYDCRLLLHASGRYYFVRTISAGDQNGFYAPVFIIPEHEVRFIRIQSGPWRHQTR